MGQVLGIRDQDFLFKADQGFFFKPPTQPLPMQPLETPEPVSLETDDEWEEEEPLETPKPVSDNEEEPLEPTGSVSDNKIISEMLQDAYNLALQFYGNYDGETNKARKVLELAVYFPILGFFGYRKLVQNLVQDSNLLAVFHQYEFLDLVACLSSEDITKLQNQLDKLLPILELALLEKESEDWLWMRIRHSCIED